MQATSPCGHDDLVELARQRSEGLIAPGTWGRELEIQEDGGVFAGRYRGSDQQAGFKSTAYLFWGEGGELRFVFSCARLDAEFERETPNIGDDVVLYRGPNYKTKYDRDETKAPTGLAYGMATRPNPAALPDEPANDDDIPS
jgi:hypothetical protein